jgi:hypothetical protein
MQTLARGKSMATPHGKLQPVYCPTFYDVQMSPAANTTPAQQAVLAFSIPD